MLSMNCQFRERMGDSPSAGRPIPIRLQDDFAGLTWHDALAVSHDRIIGMFHLIASRVFARLILLYAHHSNEHRPSCRHPVRGDGNGAYQVRSLTSRGSWSDIPGPVPSMATSELCSPDAGSRIEEKSGEIPYRLDDPDVIARKLALSKTS
ncbi:hypothetical protein [Streptomyces silvisoli]|uniref:Uncharacterized protein n=1 Tax=Streptomyces silvisoli TaxID=3034235 RepID=A0ABT5ZP56_9ACTN|nr:hypothetical protein [Streptomyces silvisoli]MDF3291619.1 hypothetical protein [Streptomyces silvisoli]